MVLAKGTFIANRYEILSPLGAGGQAEVYRATDHHLHETVAIKLVRLVVPGAEWAEARILTRLRDEHILPILNADVASGQPYLVTELAKHGTMEDAVAATNGCGIDADKVVRVIRQACHGIARAHDERLTHNDIKPGNLFLNAEGECMVGDFGMASLIPPRAATAPVTGGTAVVMAPEMAASLAVGGGQSSAASDLYSLGATAYWLLAGKPAYDFAGITAGPPRWNIVATTPPPRLCDAAPHVPSYVAKAVEHAMARNANDRYASVTEFAEVLGNRPKPTRRWRRTDQHAAHVACFVGEKPGASTYEMCVEPGSTLRRANVGTIHQGSGMRATRGCKNGVSMASWPQAIRSAIKKLA